LISVMVIDSEFITLSVSLGNDFSGLLSDAAEKANPGVNHPAEALLGTEGRSGAAVLLRQIVRRLLGVAASICMHKASDHQSWKHDHHALVVGDDDPPT